MSEDRKRRGRPMGTEMDDSKMLAAIADMLIVAPGMRPTTAMRRIKRDASDAEIHRWQDKWKQRKSALINAASARAEEAKRKRAEKEAVEATRFSGVDILKFASGLPNLAAVNPIWQVFNSPEMRFARELRDNPAMRTIWEYQRSPEMQTARRIAKEMEEARRIASAHLHDSATQEALQAMKDQQEAIRALLGEAR